MTTPRFVSVLAILVVAVVCSFTTTANASIIDKASIVQSTSSINNASNHCSLYNNHTFHCVEQPDCNYCSKDNLCINTTAGDCCPSATCSNHICCMFIQGGCCAGTNGNSVCCNKQAINMQCCVAKFTGQPYCCDADSEVCSDDGSTVCLKKHIKPINVTQCHQADKFQSACDGAEDCYYCESSKKCVNITAGDCCADKSCSDGKCCIYNPSGCCSGRNYTQSTCCMYEDSKCCQANTLNGEGYCCRQDEHCASDGTATCVKKQPQCSGWDGYATDCEKENFQCRYCKASKKCINITAGECCPSDTCTDGSCCLGIEGGCCKGHTADGKNASTCCKGNTSQCCVDSASGEPFCCSESKACGPNATCVAPPPFTTASPAAPPAKQKCSAYDGHEIGCLEAPISEDCWFCSNNKCIDYSKKERQCCPNSKCTDGSCCIFGDYGCCQGNNGNSSICCGGDPTTDDFSRTRCCAAGPGGQPFCCHETQACSIDGSGKCLPIPTAAPTVAPASPSPKPSTTPSSSPAEEDTTNAASPLKKKHKMMASKRLDALRRAEEKNKKQDL